jgi:monothiol glutaredoxin
VLFMKGSPTAPQCGFSASAAGILQGYGKPFAHVNVLADPDIREGVKSYTNWPTIPQVFIKGEFVGGADILRQLHDSGELKTMIEG